MKSKNYPAILLLAGTGALIAAASMPIAAQTPIERENPLPIVPPAQVGQEGSEGPRPTSPSAAIAVSIEELRRRPLDYAGRNVTVSSEVNDVLTPWTFVLDDDRVLTVGIDNDLLVIGAAPLAHMGFRPEWRNEKVRVTGTVRILQPTDVRREYGRGVDDRIFRRHVGRPVLVATSVTRI